MYCSSCGSLINEGQSFCANCGAPVAKSVTAAQPVAAAQPIVQAQPVSPAPVKKSKGFSIAGFIIGLETIAFSWIIFVNAVSIVTGLVGAVFSIVALVRKKCGLKVLAVIGLIANIVGVVLSVLIWATMWSHDLYEFMEPFFRWFYH